MTTLSKYLFILAIFTFAAQFVFAQQPSPNGEIVMTKAQLESFLGKIAKLKKEQLVRKAETDRQPYSEQWTDLPRSRTMSADMQQTGMQPPAERSFETQRSFSGNIQSSSIADERVLTQLELVNAKLSLITSEIEMMKLRSALNNAAGYSSLDVSPLGLTQQSQPQAAQRSQTAQQPQSAQRSQAAQRSTIRPVIINPGAPSQPYVQYIPEQNLLPREMRERAPAKARARESGATPSADVTSFAGQQEQADITRRMKELEGELQLLQQLKSGSDTTEIKQYDDQISNISSQINALHEQLTLRTERTDSVLDKKDRDLLNLLRDFSYNVYFENNSTTIPATDYSKLQEVVRIAQANPEVTVVLRGFASKAGNARYNEKISFERAASVKDWLLKNGLSLKDIVTLHHGVDNSVDASRARRVEIGFRVPSLGFTTAPSSQ